MESPASQQKPDKTQISTSSNVVNTIITILIALGVPTAIISSLQPFFVQNPLWLIPMGIVSVVILIIMRSNRLQTLLDNFFTKPLLDRVEILLIRIFSHTWRYYQEAIFDYYKFFSPIRLTPNIDSTLEFLKIFVEPKIKQNHKLEDVLPVPIAEPTSVITGKLDNPQINAQTIGYWLTEKRFSEYKIVLLGSPGSGKTALLQYLTLILAKNAFHPTLPWTDRKTRRYFNLLHNKIPILLSLPDHIADIRTNPTTFTIAHALQTDMNHKGMSHIPDLKWIEYHLEKGHCLVMLDGFDDIVNSDTRKQAFKWIQREMTCYKENGFLLASRPQSYSSGEGLPGTMRLEILSFDETQIRTFVSKMSAAVTEKTPELKTDPQKLLLRLQENTTVWDLAHNPLLLAMSVSTHIYTSNPLPERRAEFYKQICDVLLGEMQEERGADFPYTAQKLKAVLQLLCYALMQEHQSSQIDIQDTYRRREIENRIKEIDKDMTLKEFLKMIFDSTGLLKETRREGQYELFHPTMKEYLAAAHLHETKNGWKSLLDKIDQPEWKEIILLYCALGDASPIITACLTKQALELAFACEREADRIVDQKVKEALKKQREVITTETDPTHRSIIAQSLLQQRLHAMILLSKDTYIMTDYVTCAEYELFLNQHSPQGGFYQPDHWSTPSLDIAQGMTAVFGVRTSDLEAFCQALTATDRDGWRYRPPTTHESKLFKTDESLQNLSIRLPSNTGYFDDQRHFHWKAGIPQLDLHDIKSKVNNLLQEDLQTLVCSHVLSNLVNPLKDAKTLKDILTQKIDDDSTLRITCADEIEKALNRIPAYALDLTRFVKPYAFSDSINRKYMHMRDIDFEQVERLTQVLGESIASILNRKDNFSKDQSVQKQRTTLRWSVRCYAWIIAHILLCWSEQASFAPSSERRWPFHNRRSLVQAQAAYQQTVDYYLDLCISFALLELRIREELAPWEGILLVRERS